MGFFDFIRGTNVPHKGKVLAMWLKELQDQFVIRMADIENEVADAVVDEDGGEGAFAQSTMGDDDTGKGIGRKKRATERETTSQQDTITDTDTDLLANLEGRNINNAHTANIQQSPFSSSSFFMDPAGSMNSEDDEEDWCIRTDSKAATPVSRHEMTGAQQVED